MRRFAAAVLAAALAGPLAEAQGPAHGVTVPGGFKSFRGKIVEKLDVSQYSYLRIATGAEEIWAAVARTDRKVGDEVTLADAYAMQGFESRELKRRFEVLYFGPLADPAGTSDVARLAAAHAGGAKASEVKVQKVARAPGAEGRTVAEVWAQRAALAGKVVAVRATVVKATAVMGKTFLHLRDGTGSAEGGTNDVPATTADAVAAGEVVTVRGTVVVDRDFGSGYTYRVLVEDARVAK